jgi:CDGSH-type Zn-finger protein
MSSDDVSCPLTRRVCHLSQCGIRRRRPAIVPYLCPFRVHLEVGKLYRYCTCGRSKDQPWCDDSHTYTDPEPIEFSIDVQQTWHILCGCKYTLKPPFCDGSAEQEAQSPNARRCSSCTPSADGYTCCVSLLCSSHIHAVDGYEEMSSCSSAAASTAANADTSMDS